MESGIVKIHGKEYRTVGKRIADFREQHPYFTISTEVLSCANLVLVKATIIDDSGKIVATGHAEEDRDSSNSITKTSALEVCETSAVGRALAFFGMGGTEIASADEVVNAQNQQSQKETYAKMVTFTTALKTHWIALQAICEYLDDPTRDNVAYAREALNELPEQDQMYLMRPPTKGGYFSTAQIKLLREGYSG